MLSMNEQIFIGEMNLDKRLSQDHYDCLCKIQNTSKYFYVYGYERFVINLEETAKKIIWC